MKNVTIKKFLGVTMALAMLSTTFAGCGKKETAESTATKNTSQSVEKTEEASKVTEEVAELEPVTLTIHLPGKELEGTKDVIEAFNAKLADILPNTTVEFELHGTYGEYGEAWSMLLAGKEKMDIAWAGWTTPMLNDVKDGSLMGVSSMINESTPNLLDEIETFSTHAASFTYEGEIYGIPCVQPTTFESQGFFFSPMIEPYLDVEAMIDELRNNHKLTERVLDLMEAAVQAAIDAGAIKVGDLSWNIPVAGMALGLKGYLDASHHMVFDPLSGNMEILYEWEVPEMQMCYERFAKWYDWGWLTESQVVGQLPEGSTQLFGFVHQYNQSWIDADERGMIKDLKNNSDGNLWTLILSNRPEDFCQGFSDFGGFSSYLVIPYYAENPERSMMLLDLLRGDVGTPGNDLLNLLCYGFEENSPEAKKYGWCNYTAVEEDGQLKVDTTVRNGAESKHSITNWVIGNTFKTMHDGSALTTAGKKNYALKYWDEVYPYVRKTPASGMGYDPEAFRDDLADMMNLYT